MAKALAQFSITRTGEDYLLTIEDQDGETIELTAAYDQLDLITEAIEDRLDADEGDWRSSPGRGGGSAQR